MTTMEQAKTARTVKLRVTVAYEGTCYQGWQTQKIGTGVQQKVEEALAKLFPSEPRLHSSSRTDTGVHARGMVAHFEVPQASLKMPAQKLALALNAWLPPDIRVVECTRPRKDFHARFQAKGKQYRYFIWSHPVMDPLIRRTAWHVPRRLNLKAMREGAGHFIGKHDFRGFTANQGYAKDSTERTLTRCDVRRSGNLITIIIEGDGFLYRMCRGIAGTLVQVGFGRFQPQDVRHMLTKKDRRLAGMSAPPHGLVLWKVFYGKSK
jgi:tRNA pseudouridine38-40 synthase